MTTKDKLIQELESPPEALMAELLVHARNLRQKNVRGARESANACEPSLARDWLRPEEDETWNDLRPLRG